MRHSSPLPTERSMPGPPPRKASGRRFDTIIRTPWCASACSAGNDRRCGMCTVREVGSTATQARDDGMSDVDEDVKALSSSLVNDANELARIEAEKKQLPADDPRSSDIARRSEEIAREILPKTVAERELTDEAARKA